MEVTFGEQAGGESHADGNCDPHITEQLDSV
jgi:hypothetical protein